MKTAKISAAVWSGLTSLSKGPQKKTKNRTEKE
jgi:hypothetical protein